MDGDTGDRPNRRKVATDASAQAGVDQAHWQTVAGYNVGAAVVWSPETRAAFHVTPCVGTCRVITEPAVREEPAGMLLPVSRTDLDIWLGEARETIKSDAMPKEYAQLLGAASSWPDIVRSRSELLDIEREQRDLARKEGRRYKAPGRRVRPSKVALDRLHVLLGYVCSLEAEERALVVSWLEGVGFTVIGRFVGVTKQGAAKRFRKAGDNMWRRISADHTR